MKRLAIGVAVAAVLAGTGVIHAQGKTDPTLNKLTAEFEAAFNSKDAAKVASLYAEDAVAMPPNRPMVKGRSAIEAQLRADMQKENVTDGGG